jgi:Base plate wedge protein 53.
MAKYFENFPVVEYEGKKVRDITRRNNFVRSITTNPMLFLPYTVKQNERAEDVANFYYGSVDYVWLVYMANQIIDPYYEWPMDEETFNKYLIAKYEDESGLTGDDVVDWARDEGNDDNIIYYYKLV